MLEEALKYFRKLENVVFSLEYDNGESYEDHWTSVSNVAYRSIDKLLEENQIGDIVAVAYKNEKQPSEVEQEVYEYGLYFENDSNSKRMKRLRKKMEKLEDEIYGSGEKTFEKLDERKKNIKYDKINEISSLINGIENDHSTTNLLILRLI